MREYPKNVQNIRVLNQKGQELYFEQIDKGQWRVDLESFKEAEISALSFSYEVYCHELTVRTSHIDREHAFIHGPSLFMGLIGEKILDPVLKITIPDGWQKISTGLKDISPKREEFHFTAKDYDELIDAPIEIGNHLTDGFLCEGKAHELAYFGQRLPFFDEKKMLSQMKEDIKTIVEHISQTMGGMPYEEKYTFITHFIPNKFGGLEHLNSTALQFCPFKLVERKGYLKWLELVAHEYFHTWNVKRIRPKELGPFDYTREAFTRMHWLTEGLTSFMDQLFVYRAGLSTLEEYCELMKENLNLYHSIPGRKFQSLEESSFNTWIKLYRPDENSQNSSMSYYLKGGLVFFVLNARFNEKGKNINHLLELLWKRYQENPKVGVVESEVFEMISEIAGADVREEFEVMVKTTEEIDFSSIGSLIGMKFIYKSESKDPSRSDSCSGPNISLGMKTSSRSGRVFIDSVILDSPAHKCGLNAGDEIIAINGLRVDESIFSRHEKFLVENTAYQFTVSRLNQLCDVQVVPETYSTPSLLEKIEIADAKKLSRVLGK